MNVQSTPPPVPQRPRKTWVLWLVLAVCTPILIALIFFINYRVSNGSAVKKLEARIKAKGEPLTLKDLEAARTKLPDHENGALALMDIWAKDDPTFWEAFRSGKEPMPQRIERMREEGAYLATIAKIGKSTPIPKEDLTEMQAYLAGRKEHIEAVRQALRYPKFQFPIQIAMGYAADLSHLSELRYEAETLRLLAFIEIEQGHIDAAIDALEDVGRLGHAVRDDPFVLSFLSRIGIYQRVLDAGERLLSRHSLNATQLDRLQKLTQELQMTGALHWAYISERAKIISLFKTPELLAQQDSNSEKDGDLSQYQRGMGVLRAIGWAQADERLLLETLEKILELAERDDSRSLKEIGRVLNEATDKATRFPPKLMTALVLPSATSSARFASAEARRRAALAAIATERYRLAHGSERPERLNQLVPDLIAKEPVDPFDDKPLRYKKLPTGYVIYSIGKDETDDGGKARSPNESSKPYDDTFVVER